MNALAEAASIPMNLTLTWDLFIIVFFALVIAYSFIIGKEESATVIVATYAAIVAVESVGRLLGSSSGVLAEPLARMGLTLDPALVATAKLVLLIAIVIVLSTRGGLQVTYGRELSGVMNIALTGLLGSAKAALLLSTLATSIAGISLMGAAAPETASLFSPILEQSRLLHVMIEYRDAWFALPALILLVTGILAQD